jgi:predicted  nucleic acid-binding Zn-ribbon protein
MTLSKIIPDISEDCDSKYQQEVQLTKSQINRMTEEIHTLTSSIGTLNENLSSLKSQIAEQSLSND